PVPITAGRAAKLREARRIRMPMRRLMFVAALATSIVVAPFAAHAAEDAENRLLGLSSGELALAVAFVVTTARVAFVVIAGGTVFGRSLGGAVLAVYLAHVVAEGAIYGAGAGAGAYM